MCQLILEENVYWLSNEHRKIRKSGSISPDTICVVPYIAFCVQCLLLYQDWAKFIMILMTPEPCSAHQYLHATWSTFSDPFHTFSFTMQSHYQKLTFIFNGQKKVNKVSTCLKKCAKYDDEENLAILFLQTVRDARKCARMRVCEIFL